jgi:hypothetical protein
MGSTPRARLQEWRAIELIGFVSYHLMGETVLACAETKSAATRKARSTALQ